MSFIRRFHMWAALAGTANSTPGQLQFFGINTSNPAGVQSNGSTIYARATAYSA